MVMKDDLTLGGEHTIQYVDHVLQKCILINKCHPNKFNKKEKI